MRYAKSIAALVAAIGVVAATLAAGGPVTLADGLAITSAVAGLLGVYAVPNKLSAPVAPHQCSSVCTPAPPAVPVPVEPPPLAPPVLPAGLVDPVLGDHVARHERIDPNGPSQA